MAVDHRSAIARLLVGSSSLFLLAGLDLGAALSQGMLPGCRLENGSLQCVPGLTTTPENQIQILDGEIQSEKRSAAAIKQNIAGLRHFLLAGEAERGSLLRTQLMLDGDSIEEVHIHWYRRPADSSHWQLINNASGSRYRIGADDSNASVMAVVVVKTNAGKVLRKNSNIIGPIQ
ncbi:MAG: hypothetical protein AB8E74_02675 [Prochlorococcus sp.]|nr:hypothetical protein [Prochlorococcaceae cyanobacterium Fu_MAG_50]